MEIKNTKLFVELEATPIRAAPRIGPVHEKETKTVVRAIKKAPRYPPLSAFLSDLFIQEEGRVISNIPKNEKAKSIKITKKSIFGTQCVEIKYIASLPKSKVSTNPITANINIIDPPKKKASLSPCFLLFFPFIKKLIVIGTIGKTQGVTRVKSPAPKEIRNTISIELPSFLVS